MKIMFYQVEKINLKLLPFYIAFILIIMIYIVIPIIKYLIAKIKGVDFYTKNQIIYHLFQENIFHII